MATKRKTWWRGARRTKGKRSGFEATLCSDMEFRGLPFEYEPKNGHLGYMLEYIPDFRLPNGVLVEAKGFFDSEDRTKMKRVKQANPEADIRMIFMRDQPICKGSKTMYSTWCDKHGFPYHIGDSIPEEWWHE